MNRVLIILALLIGVAFAACKKSSGPADANSAQGNNNADSLVSMSATINGVTWQTDSAYGYNIQSSGNDSGIVNLMITATKKDTTVPSTIVFNITNFSGPMTYPVNPPVNTATFYVGSTRYFSTSGEINVISNINRSLIGNFHFTADTLSIIGTFNVANP